MTLLLATLLFLASQFYTLPHSAPYYTAGLEGIELVGSLASDFWLD